MARNVPRKSRRSYYRPTRLSITASKFGPGGPKRKLPVQPREEVAIYNWRKGGSIEDLIISANKIGEQPITQEHRQELLVARLKIVPLPKKVTLLSSS